MSSSFHLFDWAFVVQMLSRFCLAFYMQVIQRNETDIMRSSHIMASSYVVNTRHFMTRHAWYGHLLRILVHCSRLVLMHAMNQIMW